MVKLPAGSRWFSDRACALHGDNPLLSCWSASHPVCCYGTDNQASQIHEPGVRRPAADDSQASVQGGGVPVLLSAPLLPWSLPDCYTAFRTFTFMHMVHEEPCKHSAHQLGHALPQLPDQLRVGSRPCRHACRHFRTRRSARRCRWRHARKAPPASLLQHRLVALHQAALVCCGLPHALAHVRLREPHIPGMKGGRRAAVCTRHGKLKRKPRAPMRVTTPQPLQRSASQRITAQHSVQQHGVVQHSTAPHNSIKLALDPLLLT